MKKFIIIGFGYNSKVIAEELIKDNSFEGFIDNEFAPKNDKFKKFYLGNYQKLKSFNLNKISVLIGNGQGNLRKKIVSDLNKKKIYLNWGKFISKFAIIGSKVVLKNGVIIHKGAIINNGTRIGKHCQINTGSIIEHDNNFKDYSSAAPGVITGGNVSVGTGSYLGLGCIIKNNITISNNIIIGTGSLINKNCKKNNSIYFGRPGKYVRKLLKDEIYIK